MSRNIKNSYKFIEQIWQLFRESNTREFIYQLSLKFISVLQQLFCRYVDNYKGTYYSGDLSGICLQKCLSRYEFDKISDNENCLLDVCAHYLNHRFDLLGSGWVRIYHGMKCRGLKGYRYDMGEHLQAGVDCNWLEDLINHSNLAESQRIWNLIDSDYIPIDWHIDFKSGFRWSEKIWYKDIQFGHKSGVDVKVPWELARMQQLPQLALAFLSLPEESNKRKTLQREFRNQILDFIAFNPPRFGVNWVCSMDVAIRAANWLTAYDLFLSGKTQFDDDFIDIFTRSIYEHGLHIFGNLEWNNQVRNNHYLADISGLAFIAAHLTATSEINAWLAYAVQEMITEMGHQFYPDGSNFEGSTAYHRLSAEMIYYTTALVLGLTEERLNRLKEYDYKLIKTAWGKPKFKPGQIPFYQFPEGSTSVTRECIFPVWYFDRMERMVEFIMDITKPDGHIPQVGDNDSGRFLKLAPQYHQLRVQELKKCFANLDGYNELPDDADYWMEDHLDCQNLVGAAYGLFKKSHFADRIGGEDKARENPDTNFIVGISGGIRIGSSRQLPRGNKVVQDEKTIIGSYYAFKNFLENVHSKSEDQVRITTFAIPGNDLRQCLELIMYTDFGIYLFKSKRIYMAVRCWPGHKPFLSGHMHNDQLTVELAIDGRPLLSDPGTYVYTPLPLERNRYRSVDAHFTPWPFHLEPDLSKTNTFSLPFPPVGLVMYFGHNGFWGKLPNCSVNIEMAISLEENRISIIHFPKSLKNTNSVMMSPGYGIVQVSRFAAVAVLQSRRFRF